MSWQLGPWVIQQPLWIVAALLLLLASWVLKQTSTRSDWDRVIAEPVFAYLGGRAQNRLSWNIALLTAALVALSLCKPVLRQSDDDTWRHSIGWVVLADVSRSMTLSDVVPSRLSAMRLAMSELSRQAGARPISLILFSGDAFLVAPPAFDLSVYNEHAALLEHGVLPTEGSNLARALSLATAVVQDSEFIQARLFVLGDSGGISKSSLAAARYLADAGHRLDVLVFGTAGNASGNDDTPAELVVDEESVSALAKAGNGRYLIANRFGTVDYDALNLQQQASASTHSELQALVWRQQSHWILLLVIPLMLWLFRQEANR